MKTLFKRGLPFLLTLALLVSLLSGLTLNVSAATYVYNWGERGELATELSASAEAWYGSTTYAQLSALSGSSSTSSVPYSALYEQLADMMTAAHDNPTDYDDTTSLFMYTDCENGGGSISSFYSGTAIGPSWDGGDTWNREHVWPNSKSDSGSKSNTTREVDIMMLRPTAVSENSSRGNKAYGEGSSYYHPNEESGGAYDLRGDVARVVLYVYVRYGTSSNSDGALEYMWEASGVIESKEVLLKWMEEDPVDTWELGRNDSVQSITGTRNVFVDYPELAFLLFAEDVPAGYDSPSGEGAGSAYSITATSNNTSYGTVSLSGRTITATPKTGYYAAGYTVTGGTAIVTQDGNTFTVNASTDCTVRINFAAKTAATVTFMEDGAVGSTVNTYLDDPIILPSPSNAAPLNHTFVGWVTAAVKDVTEKPTVLEVGSEQTVSATTYYALYSYEEGTGGSGQNTTFEFGANGAAEHKDGSADKTTYSETNGSYTLSITSGTKMYPSSYDATGNSCIKFGTSSVVGSMTFTVPDEVNSVILAVAQYKANTTKIQVNGTGYTITTPSNDGSYTDITVDTSVTKTVTFTTVSGGVRAMLNSITYVTAGGGTIYYTTSTCAHENQEAVDAVAADCENGGYTAGIYCHDCETYLEGHQPTAALGHAYDSVVTKPTATEQGYTTYTCTVCGDSYQDNYVPALGESHTVTFVVPDGVTAIKSMSCNNTGINLPTAEVPQGGAYAYVFAGWVKAEVNNSTVEPSICPMDEKFTTDTDVTLYALYRYTQAGGSTEYVETDIADVGASDTVVITMTYGDTVYALPNDGGTSAPEAVTVTVSGDKLSTEPAANLQWNVGGDASGYTFYPNGDVTNWLYCTNANNGVKIGDNANNLFTIDAESGYLKHTATDRFVGIYLSNPDWRCYTTTTGNIVDQTLRFFVRGTGTTYYTTVIAAPAEPEEYLLTFRVPNGVTQPESVLGNGIYKLPVISDAEKTITIGETTYTFEGWVKNACNDATVKPSEVYAENGNYSLTENTVFYALYTYDVTEEVEVEGGSSDAYKKYSGALVEGDYIIVYGTNAMTNSVSSSRLTNTTVSVTNDTISSPAASIIWHIAPYGDGYWTIYNAAAGKYAASTGVKNKAQLLADSTDTKAQWTVSGTSTYEFVNVNNNASSVNANLRNNGSYGFACYSTSTGGALTLYKVTTSTTTTTTTTYYTTTISSVADLTGATVTLGDTLGLNFHTLLSNQYANATSVTFTYYDERQNAYDNETVNIADDLYSDAYSAYLFTLDLPASYMATTVEAVLYYGGEILDIQVYSIREYAKAIIDGSYTDKQKAAAKAMLNYGAWAQNYFGYNTGDLANNVLDAGDQLTDTAAALSQVENIAQYKATVTNKLDSFIGYTLLLKDVTGLRLYFSEQVTVMVDGVAKVAEADSQNNSRYYVEIEGVNADELDTTIEITCGDMTISNLSVLSPAAIVAQNTGKSENFRNAMIALILYAQSVNDMLTEG